MGRTKQGGSVVSFIIIGVVLLGVLAGGVYLYRHVWAPGVPSETAGKPTSPSEPNKSPSGTAPSSQDQSKSSDSSQNPSNSSQNQAATPPAATTPQSGSQLPTTGPVDTLATMLALGALTAAGVAYSQSRRRASL